MKNGGRTSRMNECEFVCEKLPKVQTVNSLTISSDTTTIF